MFVDWSIVAWTMAATVFYIAIATVIELAAPRGKRSIAGRMLGLQIWLAWAFCIAVGVPLMQLGWAALGVPPIARIPFAPAGALGILAALLSLDFFAYWYHRFLHRFLWRVHVVHHSATDLHAANSYGHVFEKLAEFAVVTIPLSLFQFDTVAIPLGIVAARELLEKYIHTQTSAHLGPLSYLLVDNRFHRIHHSLEERHFDKNFGILFSFWDVLFGTAHRPANDEWPETGVTGVVPPSGVVDYLAMPLRRWVAGAQAPWVRNR